MTIMGLKNQLTLTSALSILCTVLIAYFTWSAKNWVEGVEARADDTAIKQQQLENKVSNMDVKQTLHWDAISRQLEKIDSKLDKLQDGDNEEKKKR